MLLFTTPNSNNSLYSFIASGERTPNCIDFKDLATASFTSFGFVNNVPFASEKADADKKFLMCVVGDNTVLATCAPAFGYKNKYL